MSLTPAAGFPDYSRAGASRLIPEVWSKKLLVKYYKETVWPEISNTYYEGEIKAHGERVQIRALPTVGINDYQPGMALTYPNLTNSYVELVVDKGKYYSFPVNDIIEAQSDIKSLMNIWSEAAVRDLKVAVDTDVLSGITTGEHASNSGATAGVISSSFNLGATLAPATFTSANVLKYIINAGSVLDEQNVPSDNRWIVIPTAMAGVLLQSDLKNAMLTGDSQSPLRNGNIGRIDRFQVYASNNLPTALEGGLTAYSIPFGHKDAIAFAAQMTKAEVLRNPNDFGDLVRGMIIYGYKVAKPEALGFLYGTVSN